MQPSTITSSAAPQENTDNQDKFVWGGTGPGAIWFTSSNHIKSCSQTDNTIYDETTTPVVAVRPPNYNSDFNSAFKNYFDEEFRNKSIAKLAGAVRIETESYDNGQSPVDDITNWIKFYKLHDYLKDTFPLVYETLKVETVDKISLLYTWEGSDPDLKPLLLTAHQDVVPVEPKTKNLWTHDPYGGVFDGEYLWGRGSSDCKNLLIGTLEAVEQLIKDGFKPTRSIILGFGNDEESTGFGASALNRTITERYGSDSIFAIVDEGTGVINYDDQYIAIPSTAEKGHLNVFIELTTPGGHSSVPPDHTSIGIISRLVALLEDHPFDPILSAKNPLSQFLKTVTKDSKNVPDSLKKDIQNLDKDKSANERVIEYLSKEPSTNYAIRTSQAIDIIHGGVKSNALPEYVTLLINHRISADSNSKETVDHFLTHLKKISKQFDLGIILDGEFIIPSTKNGVFNVSAQDPLEPSPISPIDGEIWDVFAGTIKHVFDDIVLKDTNETLKIAPYLMVGNTDTRRYWGLTRNIYRFQAQLAKSEDLTSGIHSVNEHISVDQHLQVLTFLYEFILNVDKVKDN
ncbi:unnamed protein product [Wickerhamomyces anomalus]